MKKLLLLAPLLLTGCGLGMNNGGGGSGYGLDAYSFMNTGSAVPTLARQQVKMQQHTMQQVSTLT